jgi:uncharacterized membrane protein YfcA
VNKKRFLRLLVPGMIGAILGAVLACSSCSRHFPPEPDEQFARLDS